MEYLAFFIIGGIIGAVAVYFLKPTKEINQEDLINSVKDSLGNVAMEALSKNSDEFIKLAEEKFSKHKELNGKELENKKSLIDKSLGDIKGSLKDVQKMVTDFEKDRANQYGNVSSQVKNAAEQTEKLRETTDSLKAVLANTKARGQWGERMAEDVLRLAGFVEGVNYLKQKALSDAGTKPDFIFMLPQKQKVNMDVKFPLDNYLRYLESESKTDKDAYKQQFLKDVKARIKEVASRDYINPADNTVDYAICFIPNEQVYSFINEHDQKLMDEAMKNKVILY